MVPFLRPSLYLAGFQEQHLVFIQTKPTAGSDKSQGPWLMVCSDQIKVESTLRTLNQCFKVRLKLQQSQTGDFCPVLHNRMNNSINGLDTCFMEKNKFPSANWACTQFTTENYYFLIKMNRNKRIPLKANCMENSQIQNWRTLIF